MPRGLRQADGSVLHALVTTVPVVGDEGEQLSLVQVQDLTERRRAEQRLRHLALHDALTDLPSRALLLEHLHRALEARSRQAPLVAALFVDLDQFKLVNDGLGHAVGDVVLRETARRLRLVTRPEDTVARLSGDEFVVVCPALSTEEEAVVIADRLSEALRPPVEVGGDEVLVSASIGIAFASSSATTPEELLRDADAAMYRAKQLGRRRYEVFDSALRERAERRGRVRRLLEGRLAEDRLVVHYQPVVELATRRVVGVEALARLRDDEGTLLLPAQFLDVAVDSGLLPRLDAAVLRTAAAEVAAWSRRAGRPLGLAVNLGVGAWTARSSRPCSRCSTTPACCRSSSSSRSASRCSAPRAPPGRPASSSSSARACASGSTTSGPVPARSRRCGACPSPSSRSAAPSWPTCRGATHRAPSSSARPSA